MVLQLWAGRQLGLSPRMQWLRQGSPSLDSGEGKGCSQQAAFLDCASASTRSMGQRLSAFLHQAA